MRTRHLIILILACLFRMQFVFSQTNKLYISPTDCPLGKTTQVKMQMDNRSEVVAIQFNLHIPDVVTLESANGIQLTEERKDDHSISVTPKGNNNYLVVVMSGNNKPFKLVSGAVIQIPLVVPDNLEVDKEYPFELTNVILADRNGKNVMTSFDAGKIKIVDDNGPDITPKNIQLQSDNFKPGGNVTLTWNVENIGGKTTDDGWNEYLYLVDELGNEYAIGNTRYTETLPAKGSISRKAEYKIGDYPGIEGKVKAKVVLKAFSDWELPVYGENNEGESQNELNMPKVLAWSLNATVVQEKGSPEVSCMLARSGSRRKEETFTFTNESKSRLQVPEQITIPKGESGTYFKIKVIDNEIANPDSFVVVTVTGNSYLELKKEIWIEDDEHPYLKMSVKESEIKEGGMVTMTLEREWNISWPLEVRLRSDHSNRFIDFPSVVIIPANQKTVEVKLNVANDDLPGLDDEVVFTASAPGHIFDLESQRFVKILDDDIPDIDLILSTTTVSEATQSVVATLKRTGVTTNKVTVHLTDNGNGRISIPASIVLEPGMTEKQFVIKTVDNAMKDGDKEVTIKGAIYVSSCNCSTAGTETGVFEKKITVLDDDDARVTSVASKTTLLEGEKGKITVSVNEVLSTPLTVKLSCDNKEVQLPSTVIIPADSRRVDVEITVPRNEESEGNRIITVVIDAGSYGKNTCWLNITDQTLSDAVVTTLQTEKEIPVNGSAKVSLTIKNEGAAALSAQAKVSVYLSTGKELNSSSIALGSLYTQKELAVGESVTLDKNFTFLEKTGDYHLIAIVNEEQTKKELSYINNTSAPFALTLAPLYTVQVSLDKSVLKTGESVMITGKATGSKIAGVPVDLYIINNGYRKVISVTTDNAGVFQTSFTPESWQMGHFSVGACYPDEGLEKEIAGFDMYGLKRVDVSPIQCEVLVGQTQTIPVKIKNIYSTASNIKVKVISGALGCEIASNGMLSLAEGGTGEILLQIKGKTVSPRMSWEKVKLQLISDEGAVLELLVYCYCRTERATLVANVERIQTTMVRGNIREYRFMIANSGGGETGEIRVTPPKAEWLSLATSEIIPSLKQGESTSVVLRLSPAEDMLLRPVMGTIAINCENGDGLAMNFVVTPVSENVGTLVVDVCDENTYTAKGAPHVSGASVRITEYNTGRLLLDAKTDVNGLCTLPALAEGYYKIVATAEGHDVVEQVILVEPGKDNKVVMNLSIQAIAIDFKVEETTLEDRYTFSTKVDFETHVPVPAVVITVPDRIEAEALQPGESLVYTVILKNEGLITAQDCEFLAPEDNSNFDFEPLVTGFFDLKAKQSVSIPVVMTRKGNVKTRSSEREVTPLPLSDCYLYDGTSYFWDCGNDRKWHKYYVPTKIMECVDDGSGFKGFPFMGGGTIFGGKGKDNNPVTGPTQILDKKEELVVGPVPPSKPSKGCIPCQMSLVGNGIKCASRFIPVLEETKDAIEEAIQEVLDERLEEELLNDGILEEDIEKLFERRDFLSFLSDLMKAATECVQQFFDPNHPELYKKVAECYKGFEDSFNTFIDDYMDKYLKGKTDEQKDIFKRRARKLVKGLGIAADVLNCLHDFAHACDHLYQTKSGTNGHIPAYITDFSNVAIKAEEGLQSYMDIMHEILGDSKEWYDCSMDELITCLDQFDMDHQAVYENVVVYKPSCVGEQTFRDFVERWNNTQANKAVENRMDLQKILNCSNKIQEHKQYAQEKGYAGIEEYFADQYVLLASKLDESSQSVCSSVALKFEQTMVLTRQAFKGTLMVKNGHESESMKNVKLNLEVISEDGSVATVREIQISPKEIQGFTGQLDGVWALAHGETGVATIEFIPTKYAAPTGPKEYTFGGTLSYLDPFTGLEVTRDLFPVTMTVSPSPNLSMDYFVQRDILGDDPFTKDVVEPMIPSEFSLLIHNVGAGDAKNVSMVTRQPKIEYNEKGLLVDFKIKSSQLNGEAESVIMGESVQNDFGTIKAGKTAYAQWWMTSTLQGHFTDYKVEATHETSYGNSDLSLLDTVRVHELIRGIRVNESVNPKVTGFMVNDLEDDLDFPDRMYLTDGTTAPVVKATSAELQKISDTEYKLDITPLANGWNYINIPDETGGRLKLLSVNEDTDLDTRKVWQTDRTLRDGKDPKYEYLIHVVDYFEDGPVTKATSSGSFRLVFEERPKTTLAIESITGLPEEDQVATSPVGTITIKFNKAVLSDALIPSMVELYYQGEKVDTKGLQFKQQQQNTYTLDLSTLTKQNGVYTLTILTSKIKDSEGFTGEGDFSVVWNQVASGKVSLTALADPEKAGTVTPSSIQVNYGKNAEFVAKANKGYQFKTWTINDRTVSTEETYLHTAIVDQTLVANFDPISYKIEISYDASQGFVTFGTGYYEFDSSLELIATPNDGYRFAGWFIEGNRVSMEERFIYKVTGDAKLEAHFEATGSDPDNPDTPGGEDPDNPDGGDPDDPTANENVETIIVQVYPTQVADYVHVGVLPAKSRLILFDFTGKQVKQVSSCEGNVDLFMGDQPSGFYLLHILAGDEQKKTVKLIKK